MWVKKENGHCILIALFYSGLMRQLLVWQSISAASSTINSLHYVCLAFVKNVESGEKLADIKTQH